MKEKLTKNVRLPRKRFDLRTATKSFEYLLTKNECRDLFLRNWITQNLLFDVPADFRLWKKTRRYYPVYSWIAKAFIWGNTPEGYDFWKRINTDWERWCNDQIRRSNES